MIYNDLALLLRFFEGAKVQKNVQVVKKARKKGHLAAAFLHLY